MNKYKEQNRIIFRFSFDLDDRNNKNIEKYELLLIFIVDCQNFTFTDALLQGSVFLTVRIIKMKKYYRFIPMIVTLLLFGYFYLYKHVYKNNNYFYQNEIHSKIIKVENYYDKSLRFYYTPEYRITTANTKDDTLKIGDSISKKSHTHKFSVYRMRNDSYEFYKRYD